VNDLEQLFEAKVRAAVLECCRLGYHPSDFEGMLAVATATRVAEKLVLSGDMQSGFRRLEKMGRLDLTIEALVVDPQFASLFHAATIDAARWRLATVKAV
jgi:hypothetical protein